ncbi:hypothetical protein CSOJ01_08076 [Colletotrichum sojae]|uniref:Uncharacterized protein n=1 Tax=Colletotrichum sojae TaxID=2175907 RepID=A0A8H6MTG8_9PEZI|nr:hypothetical protein CSOJ01_08076 [Colletotrichum sojae]
MAYQVPSDPHHDDEANQAPVRNLYSPLLATNTEAREVALQKMPQTRPYDPERDFLYIGNSTFYNFCEACGRDDWPSATRRLALALPVVDRGVWLPIAMKHLPRLESISIVYPKTAGDIDRLERVAVPRSGYRVLRPLTQEERDAVHVTADFWAENIFDPLHVVWRKSLSEHVDSARDDLSVNARREKVPSWSHETQRLCFDVVCFDRIS